MQLLQRSALTKRYPLLQLAEFVFVYFFTICSVEKFVTHKKIVVDLSVLNQKVRSCIPPYEMWEITFSSAYTAG